MVIKMSYIRGGFKFKWFKTGVSDLYVFPHSDGFIQDYKADYKDDRSFIELIGIIIWRETGSLEYANKMVGILAKKLGLKDDLR